ncbi:MAG TPA: excinuclease ABC subunit C [Candidatus Moranbacteria bacterium]|nr:excinuclease ABC subunit C [Candidatus Moranbacteria bacterium]HBU25579.1 excinuclease ABC subunit C [Candidatus Moranbacteria bacterium]
MCTIYILFLLNRDLYKGRTDDLRRRIEEHRRGKVKSTRNYLPVKLIHYEAYLDRKDAERRETFLKTTEGRRLLKQQLKESLIKLNIIKN